MRLAPLLAPTLMLALAAGPAAADVPSAEAQVWLEDGTVRGTVFVAKPVDTVAATMQNPWKVAAIDDRGTVIEEVGERGGCRLLAYRMPSFIKTLRYTARYCTKGTVYSAFLESSDDFDAYESIWEVTAVPGGSEIRYRVHTDPSFAVPRTLMEKASMKAVRSVLTKLKVALEAE